MSDVNVKASMDAIKRLGGKQIPRPLIKSKVPDPPKGAVNVLRYLGRKDKEERHSFLYADGMIAPASMLVKLPLAPGTPNAKKGLVIIVNGHEYRVSGSHSRGRVTIKKI